ncbi:hypothetical protein [Segetibacter aerophilus]|uniref:C-terminal of Roc COR-B domain-containing protein n=1 Tax=Segetibacter aerophilus TaxID=670293 RepID=A0A512BH14_9BACT|nr:hypothetical protein [Segetibacter aerophilus]GEO11165.1 hypothetical protein SAE01_36610 [Segetibacter aerophilus]
MVKGLLFKGVVLKKDKTIAEIVENSYSGNKHIAIRITGNERKEFLFLIREAIKEIHDSFRGNLLVDETIPCICSECKDSEAPYFHKLTTLNNFISRGRQQVQCNKSADDVSIQELFDGIEMADIEAEKIKFLFLIPTRIGSTWKN